MSTTDNGLCGACRSALAPLVLVMIATCGCVSGSYTGDLRSQLDCSSVAGVFFNAGRNDEDPAKVLYPDELKAFLLEELDDAFSLRQDLRRGREISVAIRYFEDGGLRYAALDRDGNALAAGISGRYTSCSRGTLRWVFKTHPGLWNTKTKYTLVINSEGKLILSRTKKVYEKDFGLPLGGKAEWTEFASDPGLDVRDVDFDWECAREPCRSSFDRALDSRTELLTALRALLDLVAVSPSGRTADAKSLGLNVDLLVGATRDELLGALGEPELCYDEDSMSTAGPRVPCSSDGVDMLYHFYRLPQGHLGGGPQLHLRFNDSTRCERAFWLYTQ